MKERLAIVDGLRTPFGKFQGALSALGADDLGARVARELIVRTDFPVGEIDEVIVGNVAQPIDAANVARVIALKASLPVGLIASTVHRNCASGMEAISSAANRIFSGEGAVYLAIGTESMSNIPFVYGRKMTKLFLNLKKTKTRLQALKVWMGFPSRRHRAHRRPGGRAHRSGVRPQHGPDRRDPGARVPCHPPRSG